MERKRSSFNSGRPHSNHWEDYFQSKKFFLGSSLFARCELLYGVRAEISDDFISVISQQGENRKAEMFCGVKHAGQLPFAAEFTQTAAGSASFLFPLVQKKKRCFLVKSQLISGLKTDNQPVLLITVTHLLPTATPDARPVSQLTSDQTVSRNHKILLPSLSSKIPERDSGKTMMESAESQDLPNLP